MLRRVSLLVPACKVAAQKKTRPEKHLYLRFLASTCKRLKIMCYRMAFSTTHTHESHLLSAGFHASTWNRARFAPFGSLLYVSCLVSI